MAKRSLKINALKPLTGDNAIAVDFGGSKIIVGLVDKKGNIRTKFRKPSSPDPDEAVSTIFSLIDRLLTADKTPLKNIAGIGISVPGMVDRKGPFNLVIERLLLSSRENPKKL